jgi:hypothetical protein
MMRALLRMFFFILLCSFQLVFSQEVKPDFSKVPGIVVAHSPASSGIYLGSPSIETLPNGHYIASHDLFGPAYKDTNMTVRVFRSIDQGLTWKQVAEIKRMIWAKLFYHRKTLYLIGCDGIVGKLSIRKSTDEGFTWSDTYDGNTGLITIDTGYHTAPVPVVIHDGRLWKAVENNDTLLSSGWLTKNYSLMMSAPVDADLLNSKSWTFSDRMLAPRWNKGFPWLEGNAVITPDGKMAVINRVHSLGDDTASYYEVSPDGKTIDKSSLKIIRLPGACKKFTIHYDKESKLYWALTNHSPKKLRGINQVERMRSTVALIYSDDLINWKIKAILLSHPDVKKVGFQYLDWFIEGNDIVALSRTAYDDGLGGAHDCHDANYITFHRFKNFRNAITTEELKDLLK